MLLETFKNFADYQLLDTGNGFRLEKWSQVVLQRPDPQIIWAPSLPKEEWQKASAVFGARGLDAESKSSNWKINKPLPNPWVINFPISNNLSAPLGAALGNPSIDTLSVTSNVTSPPKGESKKVLRSIIVEKKTSVKFLLKLSPFKHTGLFAEQAANWEWMVGLLADKFKVPSEKLSSGPTFNFPHDNLKLANKYKVLNLFAYTGGATIVLAKLGCTVTHVDASKPAITWANENHKLNNLSGDSVRWILDDCAKFVKRALKRGEKYDGIIMDPPAFGHSPSGKTWKFNEDLPNLLSDCVQMLADDAKFLIVNGYATNSSALSINNLLEDSVKNLGGKIESGELCLKQKSGRVISTGIFARWSSV